MEVKIRVRIGFLYLLKPKYTTESSSLERTICFDSFGVEHISKEINKFIGNSDIKSNIFRIQA